jgi:hypothetical protein
MQKQHTLGGYPERGNRFLKCLQWWEEWQLRILVSGSLAVQCYLALFASSRKIHIRPLYRFFIWLAYLGGDALAIYALATFFNRNKKVQHQPQLVNGSHDLEVLWAPILLIHLGGQINIFAYNIEDNELWRRHILTAVAQVRGEKHKKENSDKLSVIYT